MKRTLLASTVLRRGLMRMHFSTCFQSIKTYIIALILHITAETITQAWRKACKTLYNEGSALVSGEIFAMHQSLSKFTTCILTCLTTDSP
jgi:hypothetical protein